MRVSDLRFLLAWLLPGLTVLGVIRMPGYSAAWTLAIWWVIALVDALVPGAQHSPGPHTSEANLAYFRWILRIFVLFQVGLIALGAYAVVRGDWHTVLGVAFSVGFITGSQGITFAHELGHGKSKLDHVCAWVLMTSVCYGHFMVEHYRGHHPRAATLDDPASARYGESLYRFLPRTLWGCWVSAWRLESQRVVQMRQSWVRSPLVWSSTASLLLIGLPVQWLSTQAALKFVAFFMLQSIVAFLLLEIVNY
ncbi:MAG: fatty acid desaturase, partial [Burkholderiaceae bacterium]